jgi:hypothetical protein
MREKITLIFFSLGFLTIGIGNIVGLFSDYRIGLSSSILGLCFMVFGFIADYFLD